MNNRSIAGLVVAVAVIGVAIGGGFAVNAIFGQSGEPVPNEEGYYGPRPKTPLPVDPCAPPDIIKEFCSFLATPSAHASPDGKFRTNVAPTPFETSIRSDCPEGWESIGQPGIFSICYPQHDWELHPSGRRSDVVQPGDTGPKDADSWTSFLALTGKANNPFGFALRFFPVGLPVDPNPCVSDAVRRVGDTAVVRAATIDGVTCAIAEGERPAQRAFIWAQEVESGTIVAQTYVLDLGGEVSPLPPAPVAEIVETLRIETWRIGRP